MRYPVIIFDLDGTLLNTLDDLAASVNHAMRVCGFPEHTAARVSRFVGNGVRVLIRRAVPEGTGEEEYARAYKAFLDHYREHSRDQTAPYDGILELLRRLKSDGHRLAIVSNKIDFAVKALREKFFDGLIDIAVGDSEMMRTKPEPDMVYKAMRELGANPGECIYVGDTDVDLATAKNSGMPCISVSWGFRQRAELEDYGAKMIADTPGDILKFV